MKTPIHEVIKEIETEFEYSQRWDKRRREKNEPEINMDENKPIESWILWMEEYLHRARHEAAISTDKTAALHEVRKVANLAVACLAYRGCPVRETKVVSTT
jgi:hypothetical protein